MMDWGILSPDDLGGLRRQQDLGLGSAVRHFNDRSVPGLGGLWFPMPIVWSVLAVSLAQKTDHGALHLANAIEAKAMFHNRKGGLNRIRGSQKPARVAERKGKFDSLFPSGAYVAQPFRMGTGQPMRELGFVSGTRYNAFRLTSVGEKMLSLMEECEAQVLDWIRGGKHARGIDGISPLTTLPHDISKLIRSRLVDGNGPNDENAARRRNLINLEGKKQSSSFLEEHTQPPTDISPAHWVDLRAGAALINLRDKALEILAGVEDALKTKRNANKPQRLTPKEAAETVTDRLQDIREHADHVAERIAAAHEVSSLTFARQCRELPSADLLQALAQRDNSVICLRDGFFAPGPAAGDLRPAGVDEESAEDNRDHAFAPQLYRLWNLHCLNEELLEGKNPQSPGYPLRSIS